MSLPYTISVVAYCGDRNCKFRASHVIEKPSNLLSQEAAVKAARHEIDAHVFVKHSIIHDDSDR